MAKVGRDEDYIEVDLGGQRFTHSPSGDTLLRHEYLRYGRNFGQWDAKRRAFFDSHPHATALAVDTRDGMTVIGDVRDFHWRDGFNVGDVVVTVARNGHATDCARRIIAVQPNGDPGLLDQDDPEYCFVMEDGEILYWTTSLDAWLTKSSGGVAETRVRRPYPGEDIDELRIPAEAMLIKTLPAALKMMNGVYFASGKHPDVVDAARNAYGRIAASHAALAHEWLETQAPKFWGEGSGASIPETVVAEAAAALFEAGDVAKRALDAGVAIGWEQDNVIRYAETVKATLAERTATSLSLRVSA